MNFVLNILNVSSLTHIVLSVYYVYKEINSCSKTLNIFDVDQAVERPTVKQAVFGKGLLKVLSFRNFSDTHHLSVI